jgi:MFS family permease
VADLGRGACMLGLLFMNSKETLWVAFPLVFTATAFSSLFKPAMNSVLPAVVGDKEKLVQANSIWSQMEALSFVLGPALGGVLALLGAPQLAFLINGLTFLASAATLLLVCVPPREAPERGAAEEEGEGWLSETLVGFRFLLKENEGVLAALTLSMVSLTLVGGAFWTLTVVLADEAFGLGSQGAGFLNAAYGAGGLLGGVLAGALSSRVGLASAFIWSVTASALIFVFFGLSPAGVLPFLLLVILGAIDIVADVNGTTIIQTGTPDHLLGRVFGAFESILVSSMLVGALVAGPLIDLTGSRAATVSFAFVGLALPLLCLPHLLRLEQVLGVRMFVRRVPVLAGLPHVVLEDLGSRMTLDKVPGGAEIVREGDVGDRLYIIREGEAEVVARGGGQTEVSVATLEKNDYFGEIALLRDVPRISTVRARGPLELYTLSREDFQKLLERSEKLKTAMTGTSDARYLETQNSLLLRR